MLRDRKVELLAPAGSYESMVAAINAGADAVYMGGSRFGARAFAENPEEDRLLEAIDYVHLHQRQLYLTVNTLLKENEVGELFRYLKPYYERGLDAVIVQDLGVMALIREYFPDLPIHASTQMTVTGVYGARELKEKGVSRVVTARELSLKEIREIHDMVGIEIESFIHGALCYGYSGQCLFSSLIGGRSGNRGRCAQTCRLPFDVQKDGNNLNKRDERYVLSLKDLCTLDLIPQMIEAGICSLKIEGRMKSPRYTAGVVSIYRKYLDLYLEQGIRGYKVKEEDRKTLLELFDRGGQTEGYYRQHNGKDMVVMKEKPAFREGNQKLFDYLDQTYVEGKHQIPVEGLIEIRLGEPVIFTLTREDVSVSVSGTEPTPAIKQPATVETIKKQLNKTGNSPFYFSELSVELSGDVFLPVQELNQLRRDGLSLLEEKMKQGFLRTSSLLSVVSGKTEILIEEEEEEANLSICVSLEEAGMLPVALESPLVSDIYLDSTGFQMESFGPSVGLCHKAGKRCMLILPHIFREEAESYFIKAKPFLLEAGFDGLVVRSLEEVGFLNDQEIDLPMIFDHQMYAYNHWAREEMEKLGAIRQTLPLELNFKELLALGVQGEELLVYGRLPMMVSAQCTKKNSAGCDKKSETLWLKDRMGKLFPVKNHCRYCFNTIYNSSPLSLLTEAELVRKLEPSAIRLQFTTEKKEEIRAVIDAFSRVFLEGKDSGLVLSDFTKGHWKRGIE